MVTHAVALLVSPLRQVYFIGVPSTGLPSGYTRVYQRYVEDIYLNSLRWLSAILHDAHCLLFCVGENILPICLKFSIL